MDDLIAVGDSFDIQFVWQLPDGDYLRAVFSAEVLTSSKQRKIFRALDRLQGWTTGIGRTANTRSRDERSTEYWRWCSIWSTDA